MTTDGDSFFAERQGAAIMKHALLSRYIRLFSNKAGSRAPGKAVVYVDGYAGPGVYGDGNHGSPLIAANVAQVVGDIRDLQCFFIESDTSYASKLQNELATALPTAKVWAGEMEQYVDRLLAESHGRPMLALIDPFGLGLSMASLEKLANRKEPTDLILNVSLSAIRRYAGHLTSPKDYPARQAFINKLDSALGGDWWQPMWRADQDATAIVDEFCGRCAKLRRATMWAEVKDRWAGPTAYYLMLITGHPDGIWYFAEFMSHAHDALREADPTAQTDNELLIPLSVDWTDEIGRNIENLLDTVPQFIVGNRIAEVYGSTLGFAREKHIRAAVKRLHADGMTSTDGKGDVQSMVVKR